jgi:hypothetical protein
MTDKNPEFKAATLDAWAKAAAKSAPGGNVDALNWITPDGIAVKPLYTAEDTAHWPLRQYAAGLRALPARPASHHVRGAPLDHSPVRRLLHRRRKPTPSTARRWPPAGRACRSRLTWPRTGVTTPTIPV